MSTCLSILSVLIIAVIIYRIYLKLRLRQNGSYICLVGKTAIVTGANTGIGYTTAIDFAKRGARVILACRNKDKAEDAQKKIVKATQNFNVVYKLVDFNSLESVRAFAKDINKTEERVDILVNNAGAIFLGDKLTSDGLQVTLQVNHISAFLLTHLLIDKIKMSAPSRIVNISSNSATQANLTIDTINEYPTGFFKFWRDHTMYGNSKLCNILFTIVLAKKLENTGVAVNAVHPGGVKTEAFRIEPGIIKTLVGFHQSLFFRTAVEGAQTSIYVATSDKINGVTGKLFDNCKEIDLYKNARDPVLAQKVWEKSEELAKLESNERIN